MTLATTHLLTAIGVASAADVHSEPAPGIGIFPLLATGGLATVLIAGLIMVLRLGHLHKKQMRASEQEHVADDQ